MGLMGDGGATRATLTVRWRARLATRRAAYVLAFVLQTAIAPFFVHDWDGFVFQESVEQFLAGTTPYETAEAEPNYIFLNEQWPSPNSWYAYPPLALVIMTPVLGVLLALGVANPAILRVGLKLPLIGGNLLLAYVAGLAVRELGGDERARLRVERFLLFSPLLIFIGAVWGMFDAWTMALLIGSAVLLARRRSVAAGVAFGLAATVKVFPLFVSPIFLIWALRVMPAKRDAATFVASAVAAASAVCLPFFLTAPRGFLQQTLLMHLERPLQGFTPIGLLYVGNFTESRFGFGLWDAPAEWVGPMLSLAILVPALLVAFSYAAAGRADARLLFRATTVGMIVVLVASKVVNEQYFVMPVALLAVLAFAPGGTRLDRWTLRAWSAGGLVAALLLGFHWLTFIPKDVAPFLLGMQPMEALHGLGVFADARLGIAPNVFYVAPDVATVLAVAPAFALSVVLAAGPARDGLRHLLRESAGRGVALPRRTLALATAVALVAFPLWLAGATADAVRRTPDIPGMPEPPDRLVGATYYTWWNNPSRDPENPWGNWDRVTLTPQDGYHTTNGHQIDVDVRAMRDAGLDFAAVSYHGYDHNRFLVFAKVARHHGLYFAPLVEAGEVFGNPAHATISDDPAAPIAIRPSESAAGVLGELVRRALDASPSEAFLRLDGKPVVFVQDGHYLWPSWDDESKADLARAVLRRYDGRLDELSRSWGVPVASLDDVIARYPGNVSEFLAESRVAGDFRLALEMREARLWDIVREAAGQPIHVVSTATPWWLEITHQTSLWTYRVPTDGVFAYGIGPAYQRTPLGLTTDGVLAAFAREAAFENAWRPNATFALVTAHYDDSRLRPASVSFQLAPDDAAARGDAFGWFWSLAQRTGSRHALVASWNNYFDGTAISSTRERGRAALDELRERAEAFRASSPAGESGGERALLVANAWSGVPAHPADKRDWTYYLSRHLPWRLREAVPGVRFEEVAVDDLVLPPSPIKKPLNYSTIWIEFGSNRMNVTRPVLDGWFQTLMDHVHHGGSLVLLGAGLPKPFEDVYLADGYGHLHAEPGGVVRVRWPGGEAAFPDTDRYLRVRLHRECVAIAEFVDTGDPAAWKCALGRGVLVATAMRPQGWDMRDDPGSAALLRYLYESARVDLPEDVTEHSP